MRKRTHTAVVPEPVWKWVASRDERLFGLSETLKTIQNDLEFNPPTKTPFPGRPNCFICEYNKNEGVGIYNIFVVYELDQGYVTVKGIMVPMLNEKMLI